ncbi:MAG TPA: chemotaxis response regulator protein-glutamate methylesterase [Peptococcaceae bacterium]|nr:chemotaxis response regulator protein-glutamate methylesterase [Peptococcaceae bacterium]
MARIKVLVVDDSALMRRIISDLLNSDPELEVIATARNGKEAIEKVSQLCPDVVTLDVEMPVMDGLTALKEIMKVCPTPVVMLSSLTQEGAEITVKALQLGAVDFVPKPSGSISLDLQKVKDELNRKVKVAARVRPSRLYLTQLALPLLKRKEKDLEKPPPKKLVLIGTSTGGPKALSEVLSKLPGNIPAALLIVQHMPPGFTRSLAERLDHLSELRVKEAEDGEKVVSGTAYIAPGDYHLKVEAVPPGKQPRLRLTKEPPLNGHRPSVDVLMKSAVQAGCWELIGVVLTGMGSDGCEGMKEIKAHHGKTIAEDESTAIVFGMPRAAIEAGVVDRVVPLPLISREIVKMLE